MLISLETKLIALLVLVLALIGGGWYLHHEGYEEAKTEFSQDLAIANSKAQAQLTVLNNQVKLDQGSLDASQKKIVELSERSDNEKQNFDTLRDQYATATKRLSVLAYRKSSSTESTNNPATAARTAEVTESVELMPSFSIAAIDVARGYSENLRLKNECIDLYNAAREAVNNQQLPQ